MKSSLRAFGIGVFITGASLAGYEYFVPTPEQQDAKKSEQITELQKTVNAYEVQIADLEKQLANQSKVSADATEQDESSDTTENNISEKEQNEPITSTKEDVVIATIYIYENVSLYSLGQQVEEEGIIQNGRELELYLSKPEYARSIQKGAFDLRSDMTIEEIAKILTGKKTN